MLQGLSTLLNKIVHGTQVRRPRGLTLGVGLGLICSLFDLSKLLKSISIPALPADGSLVAGRWAPHSHFPPTQP